MTYSQFVTDVIKAIVTVLEQQRQDILDVSSEQAWAVLQSLLLQYPFSAVAGGYVSYAATLQQEFTTLWSLCQVSFFEHILHFNAGY